MGVLGLWQLLAPVGQPVSLESLENNIFAVDISIWLNQAIKGYRDSEGGSVPNAHLMSLFTRLCKLMFCRIRPIIVFDGAAPELKKQTVINRQHKRDVVKQNSQHAGVKMLASYMVSQMLKSKKENLKKSLTDITLPRSKAPKDEIFLLPPLPAESLSDNFVKTEPELKLGTLTKCEMEYLSQIDLESEEFAFLPANIRLEILSTLKENRRHRSWEKYEDLPDDSQDFSSYQLNCLLKRRNLQRKVEEVQSEMRKTSTSDILCLYDADDVVQTSKIMSEDSAHYVLLKKVAKKSDDKLEVTTGYSCLFNEQEEAVHAKTGISIDNLDHYSDSNVDSVCESRNVPLAKTSTDVSLDRDMDGGLSSCRNYDSSSAGISESPKVDSDNNVMSGNSKSKETFSEKYGSALRLESPKELPECSQWENTDIAISPCNEVFTTNPQFSQDLNFHVKPCGSKTYSKVKDPDKVMEFQNKVTKNSSEVKDADKVMEFQNKVTENSSEVKDVDIPVTGVRKTGFGSLDSLQPEVHKTNICETPQYTIVDVSERNTFDITSDESDMGSICPRSAQDIFEEEVCITIQDELAVSQAALAAQEAKQQRQANTVQEHMYEECQELLRLFGVPYIISPTEAEAQCAYLDSANVTQGTITDDSDIWLFGGKRVCKNFFAQKKFVEFYQDSEVFSHFGLTRNKLINFALLTGSDYTEGIENVGPVTAMEILSEFNADGIEAMCAFKEWWSLAQKHSSPPKNKVRAKFQRLSLNAGFPSSKVYDAYLNPVVDKSTESFTWGHPDLDALRDYTKEKFGWSRSKVDDNLLPVIKRLNERTAQTHLDTYFTIRLRKEENLFPSKRIMSALKKMHPPAKVCSSKDEPPKKIVKSSRKQAELSTKVGKTKKRTKVGKDSQGKRQNLYKKDVPITVCLSEESSSDSM